jgi:hypothetical protein
MRRRRVTHATGRAERDAALEMAAELPGRGRVTIGADKGFDVRSFLEGLRDLNVTPHVAQKTSQGAVDGRTVRHEGYRLSQRQRKRIEEIFGWLKTIGLTRKTRHRGTARVNWTFIFAVAVYNLLRIRNLQTAA